MWNDWTDKPLDAGFDADVAQGRGCKPVGRAEAMEQALPRAVGDHFFTEMAENLGLDSLDLEAGLVLDDPAGLQARGSLGPDRRVEEKARFGEAWSPGPREPRSGGSDP